MTTLVAHTSATNSILFAAIALSLYLFIGRFFLYRAKKAVPDHTLTQSEHGLISIASAVAAGCLTILTQLLIFG